MREKTKEIIKIILIQIICFLMMYLGAYLRNIQREKEYNKEEYIKQLEQSLSEQIQEVEVYRGILETYQTEGIINE